MSERDEFEALKPCPFCGGQVELERATDTRSEIYGVRKWWGVVCRNTSNLGGTCCIQQIPSASEEAAIERWNRRAPQAVPDGWKLVPAVATPEWVEACIKTGASIDTFEEMIADILTAAPQASQEPEKALTDVDIVNIAREHLHTVDGHNIMFHLRHAGHDAIIAFTRAILAASQPFPKLFGFDVMVDDILPEGTMELRYQKYQD